VFHFQEFVERHALPHFSLVNMRAPAATQLYLETGGNLRKVQQFLQHVRLSTTVKYLLSSITEPFHARVIQKAQEKMLERITVIPEKRATGVSRLKLPREQAWKIAVGRFDTGSGSCRDPYDSPQPGEEKGRPCTSFHACFMRTKTKTRPTTSQRKGYVGALRRRRAVASPTLSSAT
jgi:hypothetical protein